MTIVWFEIAIANPAQTLVFYQAVFGWELKKFPNAPEESRRELWHLYDNGQAIGGIYLNKTLSGANSVEIYLKIAKVSDVLKKAETNGGSIDLPKTKRPDGPGFYARIKDPDGNIIGVFEAEE